MNRGAKTLFMPVALLAEGVDRNIMGLAVVRTDQTSPSSRRAWIEIPFRTSRGRSTKRSPSSRRAWIEIKSSMLVWPLAWSPSSRRAWIEILQDMDSGLLVWVALLAEGVDRNCLACGT